MKKNFLLLALMLISVCAFGQEKNDSITKPKKFASWTISNAFQAESGFAGSYWKPTFNIAIDKDGYYCVVNLYNENGYYSVDSDLLPHLYLKTANDYIVDLELDGEEPIHKFYLAGYYVGRVWFPGRYVTRFIYYIPDIYDFLANDYVKYRVWLGEGFKDVEMSKGYSKKFNRRLREAKEQVTEKYKTKQHTLNNPLEGF